MEAPHFFRQASRLTSPSTTTVNTRIPPIARRTTTTTTTSSSGASTIIPTHIVLLSRNKLQRETATKSPDLRRCLAHQRLLHRSIEAAQQAVRAQMATFSLEDEDTIDEEEEFDDPRSYTSSPIETAPPVTAIREQITGAVRAMVRRRSASASASASTPTSSSAVPATAQKHSAAGLKRVASQQNLLAASNDSGAVNLVSKEGPRQASVAVAVGGPAVLRKTKRYTSRIVFGRRRWPLYGHAHAHAPQQPALVS
ncbi:hypothetical protein ASPACDRAFT_1889557 [Aspergillus aculeatus ATCC 16872]|uniref:Uncharacterized protein n=1 Tax=Aspergillus aculeatus (strain ATCC 16872 / CBS 172.66 / WB 5094) TaxID=690307 RepID=A0A1L9WQ58_ASPA1|nr:uncharacterized protein ASPACDRAFT_1889557 [Aspergillus aculeatus ATCC 16872]OJJ98313.1 hypothetical protein ASPACDRAFT_1889557 [Aspergillus aculeatus ATCC 16872]